MRTITQARTRACPRRLWLNPKCLVCIKDDFIEPAPDASTTCDRNSTASSCCRCRSTAESNAALLVSRARLRSTTAPTSPSDTASENRWECLDLSPDHPALQYR